jgi:UDP-3-O-[3-hydroxymyristoyl] glucosamine N-acyltransferase
MSEEKKAYSLAELSKLTGAILNGNPHSLVCGVADLYTATENDVSFFSVGASLEALHATRAGAIFVSQATPQATEHNFLVVDNASKAFQMAVKLFFITTPSAFIGEIHPTAVIHPSAKIAENVSIAPYVVIDQNVTIGKGTTIHPHVSIGPDVTIGEECLIYPHVTLREGTRLGNRVILQPGAVLGSCGFGYTQDRAGKSHKIEQLGTVAIEDDVEIGANSCIDRARFGVTKIGEGSKIDNQVQIAHNVHLGKHNIIAGQTGIAGSVITGDYVMTGGQSAINGHLKIASKTLIAARAGVTKAIGPGKFIGLPAIPADKYNRNAVTLKNIDKHLEKIKERLEKLEKE